MKRRSVSYLGKVLLGGLALAGLNNTADANVVVKTVPQQTQVVADGTTEYRVDVVGDTTQEVGKKIRSAEWALYLPNQVVFSRSDIPDPIGNPSQSLDDFFYNFYMNPIRNYTDDTLGTSGPAGWNASLTDNTRSVDLSDGPTNVQEKVLGSYWFTVPVGTPAGQTNFVQGYTKLTATDGTQYFPSFKMTIQNIPFTIYSPNNPQIQAWRSERTHGTGESLLDYAIPLNPNPAQVVSEPRLGGVRRVAVDFNGAVMAADGSLDVGDVSVRDDLNNPYAPQSVSLGNGGATVYIDFAQGALPDQRRYSFDLTGKFKAAAFPNSMMTGNAQCDVRSLVGDVNGDGTLNLIDVAAARTKYGQALGAATARYDLNVDGKVNLIDVALAKTMRGHHAP